MLVGGFNPSAKVFVKLDHLFRQLRVNIKEKSVTPRTSDSNEFDRSAGHRFFGLMKRQGTFEMMSSVRDATVTPISI